MERNRRSFSLDMVGDMADLSNRLNPQPLPFESPCDHFSHVSSTYPSLQ